MSTPKRILIVGVPLLIVGVSIGLLALFRVQQAKEFSLPHQLETPEGTNYILRLQETVIGKTDTGCVLIVYVQFENPNPFDVTLARRSFVLSTRRVRYLPSTTGTQTELIKLPAHGVSGKELLSFAVPESAFMRRLTLLIDYKYRIAIKDEFPYDRPLEAGQFRSFRRRSW